MNTGIFMIEIHVEMRATNMLCLLLAIGIAVKAQREPRFKYNYTFKLNVHTCPSTILKDTLIASPGASTVEVELKDCDNKPITSSATVSVKTKGSKTILTATNDTGKAVIAQASGVYNIVILAIGYNDFTKDIAVTSTNKHQLIIVLDKPASEIYDIHSKTPLSIKKIEDIKACVEQNPANPFKCSVKNAYSISIDI